MGAIGITFVSSINERSKMNTLNACREPNRITYFMGPSEALGSDETKRFLNELIRTIGRAVNILIVGALGALPKLLQWVVNWSEYSAASYNRSETQIDSRYESNVHYIRGLLK